MKLNHLLMILAAIFVISPLLHSVEGNGILHLLFMGFLFWVGWQLIKNNPFTPKQGDDDPNNPFRFGADEQDARQDQEEPTPHLQRHAEPEKPHQDLFDDEAAHDEPETEDVRSRVLAQLQMDKLKGQQSTIWHVTPNFVSKMGQQVGRFKETPIPEWIETSDGKMAEFTGITDIRLPKECACLELIDRKELIIPPGLVYTVT
ncbi:hypothetical protein [Magnetococcus sp. PR-3]|uniref:hypothetical protein n=1 Tax=Magnetococcus sp. PR-3 TaxID=3120355 RepID=UPI002FCE105E